MTEIDKRVTFTLTAKAFAKLEKLRDTMEVGTVSEAIRMCIRDKYISECGPVLLRGGKDE